MKLSAAFRHYNSGGARMPRIVDDVLRSPGLPLEASSRSFFESRFHGDFTHVPSLRPQALAVGAPGDAFEREAHRFADGIGSARPDTPRGAGLAHVRVHTGPDAAASASALRARAFTAGSHIVFGENEYAPHTTRGRNLLAHELAHVQQQAKHGPRIQRAETDDDPAHIPCETVGDGTAKLNSEINRRLDIARKKAAVKGGNRLQVVEAVHSELTETKYIGTYTELEYWAEHNLPHRGGGVPIITSIGAFPLIVPASAGTRYEGVWRKATIAHIAPVVKLNGICCGTDKIGHFFQQGYQYYRITQPKVLGGYGQPAETAEAWGEWMEGAVGAKRSAGSRAWIAEASKQSEDDAKIRGQEQGDYGLDETGVFSNADLAANKAGLQFWTDLFVNPSLSFDIAKYISKNWNETEAGNIYAPDVAEHVRENRGKLGPHDQEAK